MGPSGQIGATIYEDWGSRDERVMEKVVTLRDSEELQDIVSIMN